MGKRSGMLSVLQVFVGAIGCVDSFSLGTIHPLTPAHHAPTGRAARPQEAENSEEIVSRVLTPEKALEIGLKIWQNECGGTLEGLTSWNEGEEFASLGIAHFIWHPRVKRSDFVETFPELIQFLRDNDVEMPRWIEEARHCPWKTREQFLHALNDHRMVELRDLLRRTVHWQVQFLHARLEHALPVLLGEALDAKQKEKVRSNYVRILNSSNGVYILMDYINFKGYGTASEESYNGWGWGLFQVLTAMPGDRSANPVDEFVQAAKKLLEQRAANAPALRNEQRYLKGWFHRLDTYTQPT